MVGVLRREKNNIVFQAQMALEHFKKIDELYDELQFWGTINGTPVTLMSVHSCNWSSSYGSKIVDIIFDPYEIIIGRCYEDEPKVCSISASITALYHMFSQKPLDLVFDLSKDNPYLLKYTYPKRIEVDDKYGHLQIYQTFSQKATGNAIIHSILPMIEYQFRKSVGIMDALGRIASVRNLFSFFANGYLPLENIEFADEHSEKIESQPLCDIVLYLNHQENIPSRNEPFLIRTKDFKEDFSHIWQSWLEMYEGANSILTIFYEIICNRSTRVNCFLNLAQSIEVYSGQYRKTEVAELARKYENTKPGKKPRIYLKHRFEDVFSHFNDCLEISEDEIPVLAKNLADMRNYYTHYNGENYTEPSYQEMFSATNVLRFVLLTIVYRQLGLNTEAIIDARKRVEFQFYREDIKEILKYISKKT